MKKTNGLFVTFEGPEASGKSSQIILLKKYLKKNKIPFLVTREPGGTIGAEMIRDIILKDYFCSGSKEKFNKYTDTLLYLAARNEHIEKKIKPAILKKKIIICDRFIDSTSVHKYILGNIRPDITFVLKANISNAMKRIKKRRKKNRYDKFSKNYYYRVQKAFLKIAKLNKKRYVVIDNSLDTPITEKLIFNKFIKTVNR